MQNMAQRQYFGTDGVRGRVGVAPMTPDWVLKLGWAAGTVFASEGRCKVLIGKDTRLSGYLFESALEAGFASAGVDVGLLGPMPTPAIAYLAQTFRARAGVVISASHNPAHDNGVKFFDGHGKKLPDSIELAIEKQVDEIFGTVDPDDLGKAHRVDDAQGRYIEFCKASFREESLAGLKIVVDCGHGATYHIGPPALKELGAEVIPMGVEPDGFNINQGCGSTAVRGLSERVLAENADVGVAFDGDGDRCIMVDHLGRVIDGDQLLYIIAMERLFTGQLNGPVVGTLMSNLGLELALKKSEIQFERAAVGDRYVMERLRECKGMLGGESSGHIICLDRTTTGDGIVCALQILAAMVRNRASLAELAEPMEKCPQILVNVPVNNGEARALTKDDAVLNSVAQVEQELGSDGRVLLRPSGTEPLVRVMVEGIDDAFIRQSAEKIADAVRQAAT